MTVATAKGDWEASVARAQEEPAVPQLPIRGVSVHSITPHRTIISTLLRYVEALATTEHTKLWINADIWLTHC